MKIENKEKKIEMLLESIEALKPITSDISIELCASSYQLNNNTGKSLDEVANEFFSLFSILYQKRKIIRRDGLWKIPEKKYPTLIEGYIT